MSLACLRTCLKNKCKQTSIDNVIKRNAYHNVPMPKFFLCIFTSDINWFPHSKKGHFNVPTEQQDKDFHIFLKSGLRNTMLLLAQFCR